MPAIPGYVTFTTLRQALDELGKPNGLWIEDGTLTVRADSINEVFSHKQLNGLTQVVRLNARRADVIVQGAHDEVCAAISASLKEPQ